MPSEAPQATMEAELCGKDGQRGRALRLGQTWENNLAKLPLGKKPWRKYLTNINCPVGRGVGVYILQN